MTAWGGQGVIRSGYILRSGQGGDIPAPSSMLGQGWEGLMFVILAAGLIRLSFPVLSQAPSVWPESRQHWQLRAGGVWSLLVPGACALCGAIPQRQGCS